MWRPVIWAVVAGAGAIAANEALGRPVPFLRWSFLRMLLGMKKLATDWQVGDGREEEVAAYVLGRAPRGDLDAAIRAIDEFAYREKFLINVGDEKGRILDAAVTRVAPMRVLELGTYVGYSALRMARRLPEGGRVYSVEFSPANASIARRIIEHAGASDRVTVVVGTLGDGGATMQVLAAEHGFAPGSVDLVFVDHDKRAYLPDLQRILGAGWLREGSVVVADNVRMPGAPEYKAYMAREQGRTWDTREHETHVEYQSVLSDLVLESTLLAAPRSN